MIATLMAQALALLAGRGLIIALTAGLALTVAMWDRSRIASAERRGAETVRASIEKSTDANAKKADAARAAAERIPADRLHDRYFRD